MDFLAITLDGADGSVQFLDVAEPCHNRRDVTFPTGNKMWTLRKKMSGTHVAVEMWDTPNGGMAHRYYMGECNDVMEKLDNVLPLQVTYLKNRTQALVSVHTSSSEDDDDDSSSEERDESSYLAIFSLAP